MKWTWPELDLKKKKKKSVRWIMRQWAAGLRHVTSPHPSCRNTTPPTSSNTCSCFVSVSLRFCNQNSENIPKSRKDVEVAKWFFSPSWSRARRWCSWSTVTQGWADVLSWDCYRLPLWRMMRQHGPQCLVCCLVRWELLWGFILHIPCCITVM